VHQSRSGGWEREGGSDLSDYGVFEHEQHVQIRVVASYCVLIVSILAFSVVINQVVSLLFSKRGINNKVVHLSVAFAPLTE